MALFNQTELTLSGILVARSAMKSADSILKESYSAFEETRTYDIFLSHSYRDANFILGLIAFIEDLGYSVYVDWIIDPQLDRTRVTRHTASLLKDRMDNCKSLFFAVSENTPNSVWMPWELGYFDGIKGKVAILPILASTQETNTYKGQEYLGLYPYVTKDPASGGKMCLWIHESPTVYVNYSIWLNGREPHQH